MSPGQLGAEFAAAEGTGFGVGQLSSEAGLRALGSPKSHSPSSSRPSSLSAGVPGRSGVGHRPVDRPVLTNAASPERARTVTDRGRR